MRECIIKSRPQRVALIEGSSPIRETVLAAPPPMHRRLAPCASEAVDNNAQLSYLRSVVNRLARQATEKDAQWNAVRHRFLRNSGGYRPSL